MNYAVMSQEKRRELGWKNYWADTQIQVKEPEYGWEVHSAPDTCMAGIEAMCPDRVTALRIAKALRLLDYTERALKGE